MVLRYSRWKIGDHREVYRQDRFMKIYINLAQTTYFHLVKWRLEIKSHLGGVRWQMISFWQTSPPEKSLGQIGLWKFIKPSSIYLLPSCKMVFGKSKPSRRSSVINDFRLPPPGPPSCKNKLTKVFLTRYTIGKKLVFKIESICFARNNGYAVVSFENIFAINFLYFNIKILLGL